MNMVPSTGRTFSRRNRRPDCDGNRSVDGDGDGIFFVEILFIQEMQDSIGNKRGHDAIVSLVDIIVISRH